MDASSLTSNARHGRITTDAFRPHPLPCSAHLQTIVPSLFRPMPQIALRRGYIELDDGDFVGGGWSSGGHVRFLATRSDRTSRWWLEHHFEEFLASAPSGAQPSSDAGSHMASP